MQFLIFYLQYLPYNFPLRLNHKYIKNLNSIFIIFIKYKLFEYDHQYILFINRFFVRIHFLCCQLLFHLFKMNNNQ